jgi:signal transduction histidine kinase
MYESPIRILLVEDDLQDALLVTRRLERELGSLDRVTLDRVGTLEEGIDVLGKRETDAVLLDLHLPDSAGTDTVRRLRAADPQVPIVVFTSAGEREVPVRALKAGAQDYLGKGDFETGPLIHRCLRYAIERVRIQAENERMRRELDEAERSQSLGVLGLGAAFGFDQLIGAVLDHTDDAIGLLDESRLSERVRSHLLASRDAAARAAELAAQLRDYARADRAPRRVMGLADLVRSSRPQLEAVAGPEIVIECDLDEGTPGVRANPLDMHQLLLNLVINAVEAIRPDSGIVRITTGSAWADAETFSCGQGAPGLPEGPYACLAITDSGAGLEDPLGRRIFDPFFTTKFAGRGLGLAAALGIVRRHRGWIRAGNDPERGARFEVLLPTAL